MTEDILTFDTETTGLPKDYKAPVHKLDNWPRIVQIAWVKADPTGLIKEEEEFIIKPDGWVISKDASDIHGVTTERALDEGVPLQGVMDKFAAFVNDSKVLAAHNIGFDEMVIGAEFIRSSIDEKPFLKMKRICTMKQSTAFCKCLPVRYGSYKWPKLQELYFKLFGEYFEEAHNALADVQATVKCLFELIKRGVITLK